MQKDVFIVIVGVALFAVVWVWWSHFLELRNVNNNNGSIVCTADVQMCPDGSYVGRVAPNCDFAPCSRR